MKRTGLGRAVGRRRYPCDVSGRTDAARRRRRAGSGPRPLHTPAARRPLAGPTPGPMALRRPPGQSRHRAATPDRPMAGSAPLRPTAVPGPRRRRPPARGDAQRRRGRLASEVAAVFTGRPPARRSDSTTYTYSPAPPRPGAANPDSKPSIGPEVWGCLCGEIRDRSLAHALSHPHPQSTLTLLPSFSHSGINRYIP